MISQHKARICNKYLAKAGMLLVGGKVRNEFIEFFDAFLHGCPNESNICEELLQEEGAYLTSNFSGQIYSGIQPPRTKHGKRWAKKPTYQKWLKACLINKMAGV